MDEHQAPRPETQENLSSETFGNDRNASESIGNVPHAAEGFRSLPNPSEHLEEVSTYNLTVRDAARLFEQEGVPRTERSIVNWCTSPKPGMPPRLHGRLEPNDRRWLITEDSVRIAIAEEQAKKRAEDERIARENEAMGSVRTNERSNERTEPEHAPPAEPTAAQEKRLKDLEYELRDAQITSKAKDMYIERLEKERAGMVEQLTAMSRQVGVLETKLLSLEAPKEVPGEVRREEHQQEWQE